MMLSTKSSWRVKFGLLRVILTSVDESVVVLGVRSSSIVGFLELDGANTGGLTVGTVAHGHLAEGANGSGKKFLQDAETTNLYGPLGMRSHQCQNESLRACCWAFTKSSRGN